MHMITTINQRLKQLWSNLNCLYLARNLSLRFTIKILGSSKPNWSWQNLTVSIIFVLGGGGGGGNPAMAPIQSQFGHKL